MWARSVVLQGQQLGRREAVLQGEDRDVLAVSREGAEVLSKPLVPAPKLHHDTWRALTSRGRAHARCSRHP
jgi:hypothetical protein